MSVLSTNPEPTTIYLFQTKTIVMAQVYTGSGAVMWGRDWPEWALNIRYNRDGSQSGTFESRLNASGKMIEQHIVGYLKGHARIDYIDEDITKYLERLFVDCRVEIDRMDCGVGYRVRDRFGVLVCLVLLTYASEL